MSSDKNKDRDPKQGTGPNTASGSQEPATSWPYLKQSGSSAKAYQSPYPPINQQPRAQSALDVLAGAASQQASIPAPGSDVPRPTGTVAENESSIQPRRNQRDLAEEQRPQQRPYDQVRAALERESLRIGGQYTVLAQPSRESLDRLEALKVLCKTVVVNGATKVSDQGSGPG
ncbi:hypothetical protein PRZ48_008846 [Zasmidium cellare]|uniref:Uncharacterized protein n=1 Tax=Zasmidium cellare TaxID=395010 RepID=A0ABR0EGM3_ZASCE|nr:hypothetical protein PRZ48_008846 [Zasmidium cellare]